jgi:ATP-dependent Zn protease
MVGLFGMSSKGGLASMAGLADCGVPVDAQAVQQLIEVELQALSDKCDELLDKHVVALNEVVDLLLREETIDGQAVLDLLVEHSDVVIPLRAEVACA